MSRIDLIVPFILKFPVHIISLPSELPVDQQICHQHSHSGAHLIPPTKNWRPMLAV